MTRYRVIPYRQGSRSAKALATELGGRVLKLVGSTFKPKPDDVIINWGNTTVGAHPIGGYYSYNPEIAVRHASNKLLFFNQMKDTGVIPKFWTKKEDIPDDEYPIVCRTILSGHSGAGIVIASDADGLVDASLYVKYVKKKEEYRIHVGRSKEEYITISVQKKARRLSVPNTDVNWQVRNLSGGFIYKREGFTVPSSVEKAAHDCLRASGLDFGAVDVIYNQHEEKAYVLEINTAPGLEGQTVIDYANFFKDSA